MQIRIICDTSVLCILVTGLICSVILEKLSKKATYLREQTLSNDLEEHSR